MLTKKMLLSTFGAKIAPYGFEYQGFRNHRWTFSREADGKMQEVVIQRDIHGDRSFQMELPARLWTDGRLLDLEYHSYRDDGELEHILNLLGDHFVRRVIPELAKPEEVLPDYAITGEMYDRLADGKDGLAAQFMERHGLDWSDGTDRVLGSLLREVEGIRWKPFHEVSRKAVELAAVYGEALIRETGGEWTRERNWNGLEQTVIGNLAYENGTLDPLHYICIGWQKDGGVRTIECFLQSLREYREWVGKHRDWYGAGWQPPRLAQVTGEDLLGEEAVAETIGGKTADLGFAYVDGKYSIYCFERGQDGNREVITVRKDGAGRRGFFATLHRMKGNRTGPYLYRGFRFYRDADDMYVQLEQAGEEIREACMREEPLKNTWDIPSFRYHLTREDRRWLREGREGITERFRRANGLEETSPEGEILSCLAGRLDELKAVSYGECREELLAMAAILGDLVIREMGGHWHEYEDWRMYQTETGLTGVPVVGISLPEEMVRYWEWEGGATLLRAYREYRWHYGKWKKICALGGVEV